MNKTISTIFTDRLLYDDEIKRKIKTKFAYLFNMDSIAIDRIINFQHQIIYLAEYSSFLQIIKVFKNEFKYYSNAGIPTNDENFKRNKIKILNTKEHPYLVGTTDFNITNNNEITRKIRKILL